MHKDVRYAAGSGMTRSGECTRMCGMPRGQGDRLGLGLRLHHRLEIELTLFQRATIHPHLQGIA